jgi:hypothetical protein
MKKLFQRRTSIGWITVALAVVWRFFDIWSRIEFIYSKLWPGKNMSPILVAIATCPYSPLIFTSGGLTWIWWFSLPKDKQPTSKAKKMIAEIMMICGFFIMIGGAILYQLTDKNIIENKHQDNIVNNSNQEIQQTKTLYELFLTDFHKTRIQGKYYLKHKQDFIYEIEYLLWADFDTKTIFYSIFLPKSDTTYDACLFLIPKYNEILQGNIKSLLRGMIYHAPGSKEESYADLIFSGRVYIYHETYLLPDKINTLLEEYNKQDLSPQFRGRDYLIMKNSPLYEK